VAEAVVAALGDVSDLDACHWADVAHKVRARVEAYYPSLLKSSYASRALPILRAVLANSPLPADEPVPGTHWRPDEVAQGGMVWLEGGRLCCPYVWLWVVAHSSTDPILAPWRFDDYEEHRARLATGVDVPPGAATFEATEVVTGRLRVLKSQLFAGQELSWQDVHRGARFGGEGGAPTIRSVAMELARADHREATAGALAHSRVAVRDGDSVDVSAGRHVIINAKGAKAGDVFASLNVVPAGTVREVLQLKLKEKAKTPVTAVEYAAEEKKAVSPDDCFLLITSGRCELPRNASARRGVVDASNYRDYYGPFAGRVFAVVPNINTSPRSVLEGVPRVGLASAQKILQHRPFKDAHDAAAKTKLNIDILREFDF
jgi:DNA uptake protein ComE-like DNA-binding protein